jgi:DNA primase
VTLSSDIKELIRSRTDIASLISESLTLNAKGPNFTGLCPFHDDHNPSLMVYPDRQSFRCWSCNEGGDAFAWVMKRENVGFFDALKMLADRANIELPKSEYQSAEIAKQNDLFDVLKWAETQMHEFFLSSNDAEVARQYVKERGYTAETVDRFRIGYHPADWEWFIRRAAGNIDPAMMAEARLVKQRDKSAGYYDYFVDRIVFPIHDERGRTVAFGGRIIPGRASKDAPKYFNSPESDVFSKSRLLYGLPMAREAIGKEKSVIVVEGYADCVACHQHGVRNVVATLGTSLTDEHSERLKAFAERIVLLYDSDEPGQKAASKACGQLLGKSVDLRVAKLPSGKDPDEFLKLNGADQFREIVANAPEAWEFRLNWEIQHKGSSSVASRSRVLADMVTVLAQDAGLAGTPRESVIVGRLSTRLGVSIDDIREQLGRARRGKSKPPVARQADKFTRDDMLESEVIEIMLTEPQCVEEVRTQIGGDDFMNPEFRRVAMLMFDCCELGIEPTFENVMTQAEDLKLKSQLVTISDRARAKGFGAKLSRHLADDIRELVLRRESAAFRDYRERKAIGGAVDHAEMLRIATEFHQRRVRRT